MTLSMADNRMFVINNGRVVEDGASLGRLKSSVAAATVAKGDHTGLVSADQDFFFFFFVYKTFCITKQWIHNSKS